MNNFMDVFSLYNPLYINKYIDYFCENLSKYFLNKIHNT